MKLVVCFSIVHILIRTDNERNAGSALPEKNELISNNRNLKWLSHGVDTIFYKFAHTKK